MGLFNWRLSRKPDVKEPLERGPFHAVWFKTRQPDPGVMNYAYASLALMQNSVIDHAVHVRSHLNATQPEQLMSMQAVPAQGIPLVAGQIYGQSLFDPDNGYTDPVTGLNNVPYSKPPYGTAAPVGEII